MHANRLVLCQRVSINDLDRRHRRQGLPELAGLCLGNAAQRCAFDGSERCATRKDGATGVDGVTVADLRHPIDKCHSPDILCLVAIGSRQQG